MERRMNKKLKIFLGAYVNYPNAQNINCANIAKYLDKDKFEVHAMYIPKNPIDRKAYQAAGIHLHRLIHHRWIWHFSKWMTMKLGRYDIYYLPKIEPADRRFAQQHKKTVCISSVEGVVGEQIPSKDYAAQYYFNELMDDYFSISSCIQHSVKKYWNRDTSVLYLGVEPPLDKLETKTTVKSVVWIGSVIERTRPELFLKCAERFPNLRFTMIGDGDKSIAIQRMIQEKNLKNVFYLGRTPNEQVYRELNKSDLLLMTSDREGLPKVIGEAMISAVPSIYINQHYTVDYIENGLNGYAVDNVDGMIEKIQLLIDRPDLYQKMSCCARQTIQKYTWGNLIKDYENYFIEQYEAHCRKIRRMP